MLGKILQLVDIARTVCLLREKRSFLIKSRLLHDVVGHSNERFRTLSRCGVIDLMVMMLEVVLGGKLKHQ